MPQLALELPLVSVLPQALPLTFTLALSLVLPLAFPRRLPLALELALALTMTLAVPLAVPRELQQALPLPLAVPLPRPSWPLELAGPWGDWNSTSCASANSSPREVGFIVRNRGAWQPGCRRARRRRNGYGHRGDSLRGRGSSQATWRRG